MSFRLLLTAKIILGKVRLDPCCVVQQILFFFGVFRPAEPRGPADLLDQIGFDLFRGTVILNHLSIGSGREVEGAGLGRWGKVDIRLGSVVEVGNNSQSFRSSKTIWNSL